MLRSSNPRFLNDHQLLQISYSQPLVMDCCATVMLYLILPSMLDATGVVNPIMLTCTCLCWSQVLHRLVCQNVPPAAVHPKCCQAHLPQQLETPGWFVKFQQMMPQSVPSQYQWPRKTIVLPPKKSSINPFTYEISLIYIYKVYASIRKKTW